MPERNPGPPGPMEAAPPPRLLWDLPTRLFHWTLAGLFGGALLVAVSTPEHSPAFMLHMLAGLVLAFAILLRLVWGVVGSRPSRFGALLHGPAAVLRYLREARKGQDRPEAGHNPAAAWAILAMLLLPLGVVATGLLHGSGRAWAEEVHGALAWGMAAVAGLHLAGVAWHALRHRDGIALAMVHGRRPVAEADAIRSQRAWAGAAFLILVGAWTLHLGRGFQPGARQVVLPLTGTTVALGDPSESGGKAAGSARGARPHDDD